jgi:hypothetical protein
MRLGLFNWTSDLSDEPEYPPFFDNLKMSEDQSATYFHEGSCIIWIDGGGEFDSTEIGVIEYLVMDSYRFGQQFTSKKIPNGVYLVLSEDSMIFWEMPYFKQTSPVKERITMNYWSRYKPAVKEKFEKDPDAWCLATTGFTPEQIRDNFVFSDVEERYVCINPDWNAKAVEILTAQSPSIMRKFNKCIADKNPSAPLSSLNK